MMGYSDINFFGFDSCMGMTDDDHHVYPFTDTTKEFLGDIYTVKVGMGPSYPKPREYRVAGYQLAQADHYKQMLMAFGHLFKPTFHGSGLIADMQPLTGSEDFAFLLERCPGSYLIIGNGDGEGGCMVHNPGYDFNDEILPIGASYWATLVEQQLARQAVPQAAE